ncbi:MAG TPA: hypothetical protein PK842_01105 [Smithella sp.]|nr:hypothetical protein [Smithella sp.]
MRCKNDFSVECMKAKAFAVQSVLYAFRVFTPVLILLIILLLFVSHAIADASDYRDKGKENWVLFTFILKDAKTGEPIKGRVYYQSDLAADWFHPDNTKPLLPPGIYRVVGWERHYWQSEQKLIVNPLKGLQQQIVIDLEPVSSPRDGKSGSPLKVPPILSNLIITGNAAVKMPHMNASWFGQSSMATFHVYTNAWSEYPGGIGGGSRNSTGHIDYYFFLHTEDAQKHYERLRPGFKVIPNSSQHVSGPTPVSLGDEALQISIDTERPDGKGLLYESRKYLIRDGHFVMNMYINREIGLDFLTSPEEILKRVRALDVRQVKQMLEPEPYPWPEITPTPGSGKDVDSLGSKNEVADYASVSPEKALIAVAGVSMVLTLGVLVQLWGMGGLQSPGDIRGALEGLFSSSGGEVTETESSVPETGAVQEVEVIPKEPEALVPETVIQESRVVETVIPDPVPSGFEYQGKVWYKPPWDKGGPYWMDKSDYDAMRSMMRRGMVWSDRWGWVTPEDGKTMEAQRVAAWDEYKSNTDKDIKVLTDRIAESQEKLAEIREKQAELERIEQLRERLTELERQRELDNSFATQLSDTWDNYVEGVNRDLDALPGELGDMALDAARGIRDTTGALITAAGDTVSDLTNGDNWKAVGKAAVDTAKDLILHPLESSVKVGDVVKDAGSIAIKAADVAGNVAVAIVSDPVAFAESVVGIDNWKKVLDPNVPVGERVSRALYGAVDTALNFASGGTKTAAAGVEAGMDALKTADTVSDAAKAANAADMAADAARITPKLDDPARVQVWEVGRQAGQQKADKLAEAIKSGKPSEIKQALVECQKDKHAIGALNRADDTVKHAYNQQMKQLITDDVDKVVKEKIAQRYGLDPKDVEIVKPTNPTSKPKVGSDLDFTVKVKAKPGEIVPDPNKPGSFIQVKPGDNLTKDVPLKDAQEIYNRELYSKVTGEPIPTDPEKFKAFQAEADKLAHEMDHVAGHRVGAESYGASQQDLEVILQKSGGRFTDPEQAGMVASYKSTHLYQEAESITKLDPGKAEQLVADGMRQTTKQYSNLIETRVAALQNQGIEVAVDPRLTKAVDIFKQVETKGLPPAKAEALLKSQLNMSKDDVANMLGAQLAKLHRVKA